MSRISNRVLAGLSAGAFAVLTSQTALAGVDIHVSVPTVHISVPAVHVSVPTAGAYAPSFKAKGTPVILSTSHHDHQDSGGDRRGHGAPIGTASYRGTGGIAVYSTTYVPPGRDLPKGGRNGGSQSTSNGVSVATTTVSDTGWRDWPRGGNGGNGVPVSTGFEWISWHFIPWNIPWNILQTLEEDSQISSLFNGAGCTLPSSNNPGTGHDIQIVTGQDNANGGVWVSVSWSPSNGMPGGADQGGPNTGTITENANGTYSITFSWGYGTHVFTGTISPNGNGTWSLSGTVVVYNSQGQPEPGQGPGTGTCTLS
jgi:hypothetical protein